jgi:hypothetical protein
MRQRVVLVGFLLVFAGFSSAMAAATTNTVIATKNFVDNRIEQTNDAVVIKNTATKPVSLSANSQTTAVTPASTQVATVGWADTNRTSKVRSGSATSTTLVDIWIE